MAVDLFDLAYRSCLFLCPAEPLIAPGGLFGKHVELEIIREHWNVENPLSSSLDFDGEISRVFAAEEEPFYIVVDHSGHLLGRISDLMMANSQLIERKAPTSEQS